MSNKMQIIYGLLAIFGSWGLVYLGMTSWSTRTVLEDNKCYIQHLSFYGEEIYKETCWRHYADPNHKAR
jgi:hypothetical protein